MQTNTQSNNGELETLRGDFKRYLELGIDPVFKAANIPHDKDTDKLYAAIIEANMLAVQQLIQSRERAAEVRGEANALQWVEDLGKKATKKCSVHNMNDYYQKYGEGVSYKVHSRLLDEVLPKLQQLTNPKAGEGSEV